MINWHIRNQGWKRLVKLANSQNVNLYLRSFKASRILDTGCFFVCASIFGWSALFYLSKNFKAKITRKQKQIRKRPCGVIYSFRLKNAKIRVPLEVATFLIFLGIFESEGVSRCNHSEVCVVGLIGKRSDYYCWSGFFLWKVADSFIVLKFALV